MGIVPEKSKRQLLTTTADQITEEAEEQHGESPSDEKGVSVTVAPTHLHPTLLHLRRTLLPTSQTVQLSFPGIVFSFSFGCIYFKPFCHFVLQMKMAD